MTMSMIIPIITTATPVAMVAMTATSTEDEDEGGVTLPVMDQICCLVKQSNTYRFQM